jgi:hypothetical protein
MGFCYLGRGIDGIWTIIIWAVILLNVFFLV